MGAHLSGCISCVERERDEHGVTAVKLTAEHPDDGTSAADNSQYIDEDQAKTIAKQPSGSGRDIESKILEAQINAIVKSRAESRKQQSPLAHKPDDELQAHINAIVNARREQSPAPYSPVCSPGYISQNALQCSPEYSPGYSPENALQAQINAIVGSHASSLKEQRRSGTTEWASPAPAQCLADADLQCHANAALVRAKERSTPAKSPQARAHWDDYEDDIVPCQLNFADANDTDGDGTLAIQKDVLSAAQDEPRLSLKIDKAKVETVPFNLNEIPSPTRNRAKRQQQLLWDGVRIQSSDEQAPHEEKPIEVKAEVNLQKEVQEAAEFKVVEDVKQLQELESKAQMEAMDQMCIDAFLESVRKCAWRERVRTPIKGTNLYVKHMRPCRPCGTSVDVKDSSFRYLGEFLNFLEKEGLLRLKPGLADPVVTEIFYDACHKYKHAPSVSKGLSAPVTHSLRPAGAISRTSLQHQ